MKAMILAAGLGTRLGNLTKERPKALVPVGNRPIIDRGIDYLKSHGITELIVNAHHHPRQLIEHLAGGRPFGVHIQVRVEPVLLGTGGALRNTMDFWGPDPFVVMNADILTDIDLSKALEAHLGAGHLATLVVHDHPRFNQLAVNPDGRILTISKENRSGRLAFTGIHILDPLILDQLPKETPSNIIDCYRRLIRSGRPIGTYRVKNHRWVDIGTIESYLEANRMVLEGRTSLLGKNVKIHPSVRIRDWAVIGDNAILEEGVQVKRSVFWEDVRILRGHNVVESIVTSRRQVERDLEYQVF